MSQMNVRLTEDDARMAAALRKTGVSISALVRQAVRAEYERRVAAKRAGRPSEIVKDVLASLPDPSDLAPRGFSLDDRDAVRRHIAAQVERRRP